MPDDRSSDDEPSPSGSGKRKEAPKRRSLWDRMPSARQMGFMLFGLMLAGAFAFYVWWAIAFHVYVDNGVYAVMVTLAGFGLAGMWLTLPPRHR